MRSWYVMINWLNTPRTGEMSVIGERFEHEIKFFDPNFVDFSA